MGDEIERAGDAVRSLFFHAAFQALTTSNQCPEGDFRHCTKEVPLGHWISFSSPSGTIAMMPVFIPIYVLVAVMQSKP